MIINKQFIEETTNILDSFIEGVGQEELKMMQNNSSLGVLTKKILNEKLCYYTDEKG